MTEPAPRHFSEIRRARQSHSCETCRDRRVKCDQLRPKCTNCTRNVVDCTYPPGASRKRKSPLESTTQIPSGRPNKRQTWEGDHERLKQGYLVLQSGGRSRYTESTFWACVDAKGLELDAILPNLSLFPPNEKTDDIRDNLPFWARGPIENTSRGHGLITILTELPNQQTSDCFLAAFIENVHPLIPFIHIPTFKSLYQQFWTWRNHSQMVSQVPNGILAENPSFLPLLIAVLFSGSVSLMSVDAMAPTDIQRKLSGMMAHAQGIVGFPQNPSMFSLMAFILFNSMMMREEEALSSCSFVAVAFRVSQAMGLHRDGTDFDLDPVSVEERRRVWWHLMHLDVMTSIVSGLPLIASSNSLSNTQMISELRDEFIGRVRLAEEIDAGAIVDPNYIIAIGRYDISACIRAILLRQSTTGSMSLTTVEAVESDISQLTERTNERIRRLGLLSPYGQDSVGAGRSDGSSAIVNPRSFAVSALNSPNSSALEVNSETIKHWGKDLLRLTIEKTFCILYQPIMQHRELWTKVRTSTRAIPRFQHFLSIFLDMCTNSLYQPYHWLYPGAYQPLQPVAVLLVDLSEHATAPEASFSQSLIDRTFSLLGPTGRVSNSGNLNSSVLESHRHSSAGSKRVWTVLEKLRSKVWQELGLDQAMIWNSQIEVANQQLYLEGGFKRLDQDSAGHVSAPGHQFSTTGQMFNLQDHVIEQPQPQSRGGFDTGYVPPSHESEGPWPNAGDGHMGSSPHRLPVLQAFNQTIHVSGTTDEGFPPSIDSLQGPINPVSPGDIISQIFGMEYAGWEADS